MTVTIAKGPISVDRCLAPLIVALNEAGLRTRACCCGHGDILGSVALWDGREIILAQNWEMARAIEQTFRPRPVLTARIPCRVPHCRCTCSAEAANARGWSSFLCRKHYALVDKRVRRLRTALRRKAQAQGWPERLARVELRLWLTAVRQATERAAGL